jgi:uncharacterized protein (TIGR03000 family)
MRRYSSCYAFLVLAAVVLFALPDASGAASQHSGGFRATGPSADVYVPPYYAIQGVPAGTLSGDNDYAYGATEEIAYDAVLINVRVPAGAEVRFDGSKTSQTGGLRWFVTPALVPGRDYSYEIRARWMEAGRAVEETRKINLRAGDRLTINFTR